MPGYLRDAAPDSDGGRSTEHLLHLLEETPGDRTGGLLGQLLVLRKNLFLALREFPGHLDQHADHEVPTPAGVERGDPFPPQNEVVAGRRAWRDGEVFLPGKGRHLDRRAQRRLWKGDRNLAEKVGPFPDEERVLLHGEHHVQVADGPARGPGLPLAAQLEARAAVDARGDLHLELAAFPDVAGAAAASARVLDDLARPPAAAAGATYREEPLLHRDLALPIAGPAPLRPGPLSCARSRTVVAHP